MKGVDMEYTDIHIHALFGVDDGAKTEEEMYAIVDQAYRDGARTLCLTPHFHPGYFGDHTDKADAAFALLCQYAQKRYPELCLCLGNELRYSRDCVSWLEEGRCRTLNQTRYVLVDFSEREEERIVVTGLERLLNAGYVPVLAHAERYLNLDPEMRRLREFRENGVLIQVDVQSVFGGFGFRTKRRAKAILSSHLADFVASDAHDVTQRPPGLSAGHRYIAKKCGMVYADAVCRENALRMLQGHAVRKETTKSNA